MAYLKTSVRLINALNVRVGSVFRYLILVLTFVMIWEVFNRYVFDLPTVWAHELTSMVFAVYFLIGGAYALRWNAHISVDILYSKLSRKAQAILDLFTWSMFYLFCGVLFYKSIDFAWSSVMIMETSNSVWEPYIWPVKLFLPISALLILLQGVVKTLSDVCIIVTGEPLVEEPPEKTEQIEVEL